MPVMLKLGMLLESTGNLHNFACWYYKHGFFFFSKARTTTAPSSKNTFTQRYTSKNRKRNFYAQTKRKYKKTCILIWVDGPLSIRHFYISNWSPWLDWYPTYTYFFSKFSHQTAWVSTERPGMNLKIRGFEQSNNKLNCAKFCPQFQILYVYRIKICDLHILRNAWCFRLGVNMNMSGEIFVEFRLCAKFSGMQSKLSWRYLLETLFRLPYHYKRLLKGTAGNLCWKTGWRIDYKWDNRKKKKKNLLNRGDILTIVGGQLKATVAASIDYRCDNEKKNLELG